jgi:hypothetical protein
VSHPDIERSEIVGKGWQAGAKRQHAGVVESRFLFMVYIGVFDLNNYFKK